MSKMRSASLLLLLITISCSSSITAQPPPPPPPINHNPPPAAAAGYICFPAIFSLGDDWADTGNARALYPTQLESQEENSPYGMTFFKSPAHRLSDGRLIIDFLAQAFDLPLLASYSCGLASDIGHGISFAVAGSTASLSNLRVPYPLAIQVQWVAKFRADVLDALAHGSTQGLPDPSYFRSGLYVISAGQNDYRYALQSAAWRDIADLGYNLVPQVIENITSAIDGLAETIHARKFMVLGIPPLGCTPEILTLYGTTNASEYDDNGCLIKYNRLSALHNELLSAAATTLRALYAVEDSAFSIIYVDMYNMMLDLLHDPQSHGFWQTLLACCGIKQPYNYHEDVICGRQLVTESLNVSASACSNPKRYVSWDGIHPTEAFNRYAASSILQGQYLTPAGAFQCFSDASAASPPHPPRT